MTVEDPPEATVIDENSMTAKRLVASRIAAEGTSADAASTRVMLELIDSVPKIAKYPLIVAVAAAAVYDAFDTRRIQANPWQTTREGPTQRFLRH